MGDRIWCGKSDGVPPYHLPHPSRNVNEFCLDCVCAEHAAMKKILADLRNEIACATFPDEIGGAAERARNAFNDLGKLQETE